MPTPILATKLYIPPPRPKIVPRPHLIKRLNEGMRRKLTLISAPAGFGKTTLLSEWIYDLQSTSTSQDKIIHPKSTTLNPVSWLSLDEGDHDPIRFLAYLIAALQTILTDIGEGVSGTLQSPQPPPTEALLTNLLNEIAAIPGHFTLVLDDYHTVDSKPVDQALAFLLEHLPPQMHLVIATREDPDLPLARLRARGQLTELRAADLRFTPTEAAELLNQAMGFDLSAGDIAALETRTEGWVAGLQLAAISMQGREDTVSFIQSFTGSHHFVLDYLVEEVLEQQPESIQDFLLRTSILNRLCGPLCEAVCSIGTVPHKDTVASGQETLVYLERANLFIVPLDNERHWYRYHHLFAELLRKRLLQQAGSATGDGEKSVAELHIRASQWYEDNGLALEAFHHAAAANDIERAERLIDEGEIPLHFRSVVNTILDWLASLPAAVLDARPLLGLRAATLLLVAGQTNGVEEKLQAAEKALLAHKQNADLDDKTRDLIGQIAAARATLALTHYQPEVLIIQARRALEYLHPNDSTFRFTASWALTSAYLLQGNRAAAAQACMESISICQKSGNIFSTILATSNLGEIQELENQLHLAAETYRSVLPMFGDHPLPNAAEAYLGLARICYEWNDLEAAERHGQQSLQLARLYDRVIDRFIISEVFLARLKLARGDVDGAAALLAQVEQSARQQNFLLRMPEIAAVQVLVLLRQDSLAAAAQLAQQYELPLCQARVLLAQGNPSAALAVLEPLRQQMEARGWADERLKAMVLQAVALHLRGEKDRAAQVLGEALALAEPGGFIRTFVDEGEPMRLLIADFRLWIEKQSHTPEHRLFSYVDRLLSAFAHPVVTPQSEASVSTRPIDNLPSTILKPLSQRELEVLQLVAQGLSNREISQRLCLALNTVKGHNRIIFDKLQVQRRTEAVARARELDLV